jgi:serine/threonine protein kinase
LEIVFFFFIFEDNIGRIVRKIGKGSFGNVYLALKSGPFTDFLAVKFVKLSWENSASKEKEYQFGYMCRLNSSYLVKYYSVFRWNDYLCIFMMYYNGGCLDDIIQKHIKRKKRIPERVYFITYICIFLKVVEKILLSLLLGVYYLYFEGIVHRDIKPRNVFVKDEESFFALGLFFSLLF